MKYLLLLIYLTGPLPYLSAQDQEPSKWVVNGYVKYLHSYFILNDFNLQISDQLIHNRVNLKYYAHPNWTFKLDFRNRLFYGENVKLNLDFEKMITNANNDFFDLSLTLWSSKSHVFHSMIDRAFVEYSKDKWEVRLGRQRINWGIQTFWNPHDVFNAYSFTDFDYEERPGSDALSIKYYSGTNSSLEFAIRAADHIHNGTIAGLWRFNKWNYDFQVPIGYSRQNVFTGIGWAGNIKTAGFKGEWAYYKGLNDSEKNTLVGSMGVDYSFSNSLYLQVGLMYNSLGSTDEPISGLFSFNLSSKNLYPYKIAIFHQLGIPISPLTNGSLSIIYSPVKTHPIFLNPGITFSIASNWDLDILGQILFSKTDKFTSPIQGIFMRIKYSY